MSFIDYSNSGRGVTDRGTPASGELLEEKAGNVARRKRSGSTKRRSKNYEDFSEKDLESAARENYEEPVGNFMGDRHQKAHEGDEEGYIGGHVDPFGTGSAPSRRSSVPRVPAPVFHGEEGELDQEKAYDGYRESGYTPDLGARGQQQQQYDEDYYAPARNTAFGTGQQEDYHHQPQDLGYDPNDRNFVNPHPGPHRPTRTFVRDCFLVGFQIGSFIGTTLGFNLIVVIAIGAHIFKKMNPLHKEPPRAKCDKEYEARITGERFSSRAAYYAEYWGYKCEDVDVETEDGFVLRVHHLTSRKHKRLGHPVILQHGILSNSVTFMVNEERSLAFWLLEQGYDVWLGNIRTNFEMPHRSFKRSDPRYWAWAIKEAGIYDLPALIDHVYQARDGIKPTYIGHSQGTGTMFLGLSRGMRPDMGNKISGFVALGPAVYAGPVLRKFPFSLIRKFKARWLWDLVFGVREFIPIISILQRTLPSWLFGHTAFPVFAFLFGFHDHNWLPRQVPKFFRTVAVANSSELLYYYMRTFSYENCIFDTRYNEPWFPPAFPPLAIFYGTLDFLVLGRPLVERIRNHEPNVRLLKVGALENYEHLDMIWGINAVDECYLGIKDFIEETKGGNVPSIAVHQHRGESPRQQYQQQQPYY